MKLHGTVTSDTLKSKGSKKGYKLRSYYGKSLLWKKKSKGRMRSLWGGSSMRTESKSSRHWQEPGCWELRGSEKWLSDVIISCLVCSPWWDSRIQKEMICFVTLLITKVHSNAERRWEVPVRLACAKPEGLCKLPSPEASLSISLQEKGSG